VALAAIRVRGTAVALVGRGGAVAVEVAMEGPHDGTGHTTPAVILQLDLFVLLPAVNILQVGLLEGLLGDLVFCLRGDHFLKKPAALKGTAGCSVAGAVGFLGVALGKAKGIGPLDDLAGLAQVPTSSGYGALGGGNGTAGGSGKGLLPGRALVAPSGAAVHGAGDVGRGARRAGRDGLALAVGAVAAGGALVGGAAQAEGTRRADTPIVHHAVLGAGAALGLVLAPVAVNLTIIQGGSAAADKEVVTVDTGNLRVNSGLADRILAEETVGFHGGIDGVTAVVAVLKGRNMVGGGSGGDSAEEAVDARFDSGRSHGGGTKVVAATVPTIGHGGLSVHNSSDRDVILSVV